MNTRYVIPAPGLKVRDPDTGQALPPAGKSVQWNTWWERREADGDITVGKPPRVVTPAPAVEDEPPTKPKKR